MIKTKLVDSSRQLLSCATVAALAFPGYQAFAQATETNSSDSAVVRYAPGAAADSPSEEEVIVLSPFTVETSEDNDSYRATATLAGTRIRTDLRDVGSAVSVMTDKFLQDTNSTNSEQLLVYAVSTEVAGQGGNFLGQGDGANLTGTARRAPVQNTRVRGLAEADSTRDFYLTDIPWDSYNVGRVDLQRGPNSILFGIGSPAGIINSSLNAAQFDSFYEVEGQFGSFGSWRASGDFNQELIEDQLAVRLSVLKEETKYKAKPAFEDDDRYYIAAKWDPQFFQFEGAHTSVRGTFEKGRIDANRPRSTPPMDAITPWFALGKPAIDMATGTQQTQGNNWWGSSGNRVWDGAVIGFDGTQQGFAFPSQYQQWPVVDGGTIGSGIGDGSHRGIRTYDVFANAEYPEGAIGAYKAKSLVDRSFFDYHNNMIEGNNKHEFNDFEAYNFAISQTFMDQRLGFEIAYDNQDSSWGHENLSPGETIISVDAMATVGNGIPNPNFGRPYTIGGAGSADMYRQQRVRDVIRGTAYFELDFADIMDSDSTMSKVLGRHVFTGLYQEQKNNNQSYSGTRFYLDETYPAVKRGNSVDPDSVGQASRDSVFFHYLGPSLSGNNYSSASGLNLQGVQGKISPTNGTVQTWNNVENEWQTIPLIIHNNDLLPDSQKEWREAQKTIDKVESTAFVWQGYFFDGNIVPMYGYRKDDDTFRDAGSPASSGGLVDIHDPNWFVPATGNSESGTSNTYSIVAHLPSSWSDKMGGIGASVFYNKSENFQPDAGRRDIFGAPVPSPSGETEDYGFTLSFMEDKLWLKFNKYETTVTNASVTGQIGGQYLIGANEAWGQSAAYNFRNSLPIGATLTGQARPPGGVPYGIASYQGQDYQVTWQPAGVTTPWEVRDAEDNVIGYTYQDSPEGQALLAEVLAKEIESVNAWYATQVPEALQEAWALTDYDTVAGQTNFGAPGLTVTGDTVSKGEEYEVFYTPTPGLNISANASHTSASRLNLAKSYVDWITQRWDEYQGPAGEMRLWGPQADSLEDPDHTGESARGKYQRETMAGYNLWRALEGSDVPELRPWRFTVVGNYSFLSEGPLRGFNVGGSLRWQEASTTGFPVITDPNDPAGLALIFDVDNPYKGQAETIVDLWAGYSTALTDRVNWRIQLNVRNAFGSQDLIPVTVQPDGSGAGFRIPEPMTWAVTNTFTF